MGCHIVTNRNILVARFRVNYTVLPPTNTFVSRPDFSINAHGTHHFVVIGCILLTCQTINWACYNINSHQLPSKACMSSQRNVANNQ